MLDLPSGKQPHSNWKWPSRNSGFSLINNGGSFHGKMLVHQRVIICGISIYIVYIYICAFVLRLVYFHLFSPSKNRQWMPGFTSPKCQGFSPKVIDTWADKLTVETSSLGYCGCENPWILQLSQLEARIHIISYIYIDIYTYDKGRKGKKKPAKVREPKAAHK